jgi:hypothetical protein
MFAGNESPGNGLAREVTKFLWGSVDPLDVWMIEPEMAEAQVPTVVQQ